MVVGPLVDDVHRLAVCEVAVLGLGVVIGVHLIHETLLQTVAAAFVHEDGVGNVGLGSVVKGVRILQHLLAEGIDGVCPCLAEAERLIDFLQGLSVGSVVEHAQGKGNAQRRKYLALVAPRLAEEVKGEVVVAVDQFLLTLSQLNFLGCIKVRCREVEVLATDLV